MRFAVRRLLSDDGCHRELLYSEECAEFQKLDEYSVCLRAAVLQCQRIVDAAMGWDSRWRELLFCEERAEFEKIETEMTNCTKLLLVAVLSAQSGASSSEMIEIDEDDRDCEDIIGTRLETVNKTWLREDVMEDDDGVEKVDQEPEFCVNHVGPASGRVLPVPDAHGKGEVVQRSFVCEIQFESHRVERS